MNVQPLDVSGILGLCALATLTVNMLLGIALSTGYKKSGAWKALPAWVQQMPLVKVHNWTAYVALSLVLLHPLILLIDSSLGFVFSDLLFPIHARHQPLPVALGTLSMYALLTVIITTQKGIKKRMGFRLWKNVHLISYCTFVLVVVHGIVMDPQLKDRPVDWLDGEKLIPEICGVLILAAGLWRLSYRANK